MRVLPCDFELMVGRDTRVVSTTLEAGFVGFALGHVLRGYFVTTAVRKSLVSTLFVKCGIHSQCSIFVRIDGHARLLSASIDVAARMSTAVSAFSLHSTDGFEVFVCVYYM